MTYTFDAPLWRWEANASWYFVTLPGDVSDDVSARSNGAARGFGSVRVQVTVGATTWVTSVFPDKQRGAYVLPLKKAVRVAERLDENEPVGVTIELI